MIVNLSPGEEIRIGDAVTLIVLAVEGDLIRFGLKTSEGKSVGAGDIGKDSEAAILKQRRKGVEWN